MIQDFNQALETAYKQRGEVINQVINLEIALTDFIAKYFSSNKAKQEELKEFLLWPSSFGLTRKVELFEFILKNHEKDLLGQYPCIIPELKEIVQCRNVMAHHFLNLSGGFIKRSRSKQLELKGHKKATLTHYNPKKLERILALSNQYTAVLMHW